MIAANDSPVIFQKSFWKASHVAERERRARIRKEGGIDGDDDARSTLRGTLILLLSVGHRRWDASRRASSARLVANARRTSCPAALAAFQKITTLPSIFFSFSFFFLYVFSTPRPCPSRVDGFFFPPRFEKIRNMGYDDAFFFRIFPRKI